MSTPTTFEAPLNDAQWRLSQILGALPSRRDWLDPDLEKMARGIVSAVATTPQEKDELTRLREIVAACMKAMPCGNIATHTPENLAGRISELAQALAAESLENERLINENASMRTAIKEGHTALEKALFIHKAITTYTKQSAEDLAANMEHCGILAEAAATLSPFTQPK